MIQILCGVFGILIGIVGLVNGVYYGIVFILGGLILSAVGYRSLSKISKENGYAKDDDDKVDDKYSRINAASQEKKQAGVYNNKHTSSQKDEGIPVSISDADLNNDKAISIVENDYNGIGTTVQEYTTAEKEASEKFSQWVFEPNKHPEEILMGGTFYIYYRKQTGYLGDMWLDLISVTVCLDSYMVSYQFNCGIKSESRSIKVSNGFFASYNDIYAKIADMLNSLSQSNRLGFTEELLFEDAVVKDWIAYSNERLGLFLSKDTEPSNIFGFNVSENEAETVQKLCVDHNIKVRREPNIGRSCLVLEHDQTIKLVPAVERVIELLHHYREDVEIDNIDFYEDNHDMYEAFIDVHFSEEEFHTAAQNMNKDIHRMPGLGDTDGRAPVSFSSLSTSFCKARILFFADDIEGMVDINSRSVDIWCEVTKAAPRYVMLSDSDIGARILFNGVVTGEKDKEPEEENSVLRFPEIQLESDAELSEEELKRMKEKRNAHLRKMGYVNRNGTFVKLESIRFEKGDQIRFGQFPQEKNGEIRVVDWVVLDVTEDKAVLLSKKALIQSGYCDADKAYGNNSIRLWKNSSAREICNKQFFEQAFSREEKKYIVPYSIESADDKACCEDNVFLLSEKQVNKWMPSAESRRTEPSDYLVAHTNKTMAFIEQQGRKYAAWWLLPEENNDSGDTEIYPKAVWHSGDIQYHGRNIYHKDFTIRPAICVRLNNSGPFFKDSIYRYLYDRTYVKLISGLLVRIDRCNYTAYRLNDELKEWNEDSVLFTEYEYGELEGKVIEIDDNYPIGKPYQIKKS